jgi:hypothetical protein
MRAHGRIADVEHLGDLGNRVCAVEEFQDFRFSPYQIVRIGPGILRAGTVGNVLFRSCDRV